MRYWRDLRMETKMSCFTRTILGFALGLCLTAGVTGLICHRVISDFAMIDEAEILALTILMIALPIGGILWWWLSRNTYFFSALIPFDLNDAITVENDISKVKGKRWIITLLTSLGGLALLILMLLVGGSIDSSNVYDRFINFMKYLLLLAVAMGVPSFFLGVAPSLKEWRKGRCSTRTLKRIWAISALDLTISLGIFSIVFFLESKVIFLLAPLLGFDSGVYEVCGILLWMAEFFLIMFALFSLTNIFVPSFWISGVWPTLAGVATATGFAVIVGIWWNWYAALVLTIVVLVVWNGFFLLRKAPFKKKILAILVCLGAIIIAVPVAFLVSLPVGALRPLSLLISVVVSINVDAWMASYVT